MIFTVMNAIFSNCIEKPEKFRTSTGFEPMPSRCRCDVVTHWPMKPLMLGVSQLSISHNQWIALKAHSDWLLKLRISFDIHLRATCTGFVPKTVVIVESDASVHRLNLIISEPRFALTVLVSSWSSLLFIIFHAQIENSKQTWKFQSQYKNQSL